MRWAAILCFAGAGLAADFQRDVAPIFARRCAQCHGARAQMAGLRLDSEDNARRVSLRLVQRILSDDASFRMPPIGGKLPDTDIAAIRGWAEASGAATEIHWSFRLVNRPATPPGYRTPIDAFVRERLKREGLTPSPEADRPALARRLSLDLTGLPPTPEETAAFLADTAPGAYERLVGRLLASPRFGERWARPWLDLAHYADSDGYEKDLVRPWAWRWRQWVIEALNRDLPFDQFTILQLAADLIPGAQPEDRVATGFLRNTLTNREAGVDRAEARFEQVVDRTNTVATTWLGLTAGCAQCHNHKFDPVSQKEYYSLFAFFDAADEEDIDAPLPGQEAAYRQARAAFDRERQALLDAYRVPEHLVRWENRLREAFLNQGRDLEWDFAVTEFRAGFDWADKFLNQDPLTRGPRQRERLADYFLGHIGPDFGRDKELAARLKEVRGKLDKLREALPPLAQASVMMALAKPPATRLRLGGDYKALGPEVPPAAPAVLPPIGVPGKATRLDFARWLVSPENPLAARVAVNRVWQELFGRGLVRTAEDFGTQGEKPSHPELLDWLAAEFVEKGWSQKALIRAIVLSDTYRQSSRYRADLAAADPENVLLGRQARVRLSAELIRDSALFAAGLLSEQIGGPSFRPPQPKGVAELGYANSVKWTESPAPARYRRGLYIHYQRTTPYPMLSNFDAPGAAVACARRRVSNTPLQALNLLNDPVFVEAAQALADRAAADGGSVREVFQRALGREPQPRERRRLEAILSNGGLAAAARVILNLDEFITRE